MATVGREDLQAKVTANGKVQAQKKVDISATIPGQITHLAVKEGDRGQEGPVPPADRRGQPARQPPAAPSSRWRRCCRTSSPPAPTSTQARADLQPRRGELRGRASSPRPTSQRARTTVATARGRGQRGRPARRAGAGDARGRARHAGQDARSARPWTASSPPSASRRARSRSSASRTARARCCSRSPTCRWSRPSWRSTRRRSRRVKLGQEARIRIDAYPNQTFKGVVTEVGGSPILPAAGASQQRDQVPGEGPDQGPAAGRQARPLRAGRHPHRLPRAGAGGADPGPGRSATARGSRATPPPARRADEEGVFLMEDGKAKFQADQDGPPRRAVARGRRRASRAARRSSPAPSSRCATLKPGDAVKPEEKKKDGDEPSAS